MAKTEKKNRGYLTGREIKAIAKANAKEIKRLEAYKHRKAEEHEFLTEMKDPKNILEIEDLHTSFFTDSGEVQAVNGVSFNLDEGEILGIVGVAHVAIAPQKGGLHQLAVKQQGFLCVHISPSEMDLL